MLNSDQNKLCSCHESGICLDSRHTSWIVAVFVLLSFGFFIVGYFMGKRKAIQDLHITVDQDSLADKIYTSLCTMQEGKAVVAQQDKDTFDTLQPQPTENVGVACEQLPVISSEEVVGISELSVDSDTQDVDATLNAHQEVLQEISDKKYYAQLVGFGTEQAAERFARKLQNKKIPVVVKHRHSKTAKGKKITWYQVVTEELNDKNHLEKLVNEITLIERLKDVRIVTC